MRLTTLFAMAITPFILNAASKGEAFIQKNQESVVCESPFHVMHFDVRHTESKGVGYKDGYTTLEGFGIHDHNPYFMPFLDLRAHVFNNGKLAGNVGLGERTVIPSINHVFGLYCYYDVRQEDHGLTVNQISPGVELLGKRMEYRINGYFPVGRDESHSYGSQFERFQGYTILIQRKKKYALTGADGEIGAHITQSTRHDVYAGVGSYYFTADPSSAWGGKARLLWRYKECVSLEASYSYDHLFKNVFQGTIGFSYPLGSKLKRKGKNCPNTNDLALSRAAFAPYRFEIPVVRKKRHTETAINPTTRQPWKVWFVNNTSSSLGTFESPFPTLVQAQNASGPNDIIYVFPGDGTSKGMNNGIVLKNGQKLFGSGITQTVSTTVGSLQIPALSSRLPLLTNILAPGHVVLLANGNEVAGLECRATVSGSLLINATGYNNGGYIHDNFLSGTVDHRAIGIVGNGTFFIQNNTCIDNFLGNPFEAIRIDVDTGAFVQAFITNNRVTGYQFSIGVNANFGSSGEFEISNNVLNKTETNFSAGIYVGGGGGNSIKARVLNNRLTMLSELGIWVENGGKNICVDIQNNVIKTADGNGIQIDSSLGGQVFATLNNNQFLDLGSAFVGVKATAGANTTVCLNLSNNTAINGYNLTNNPNGKFYLGPFVNNVGPLTQTGTITPVSANTCSCN